MREAKHTPSPWRLDGYHRGKILGPQERGCSVSVAEIPYLREWNQGDPPRGTHATYDLQRANAERIVECVNGCDAARIKNPEGLAHLMRLIEARAHWEKGDALKLALARVRGE